MWWSPDYKLFLDNTAVLRFVLVSMTFMLLLSFFWVDQQSLYLKRVNEFALKVERENLQMELNNLQQKLKPHFLFNSLNSISALTASNPEEAREMIFKLSQFMRNSMKDENEFVTLDEELNNVQLYTEIEKIRFADRLIIDLKHDEEAGSVQVPHLILQPVIENAIKYGLYDALDTVHIKISSVLNENFVEIEIENPYSSDTVQAHKGTGYGLESIRKKLHIIYKQLDLLQTEAENDIFKTTIRIPV
jgi:LytS/YehU family sensor histidine kinase